MSEQLKTTMTPEQQQEAYELLLLIKSAGKTKDGKFISVAQWSIENQAGRLLASIRSNPAVIQESDDVSAEESDDEKIWKGLIKVNGVFVHLETGYTVLFDEGAEDTNGCAVTENEYRFIRYDKETGLMVMEENMEIGGEFSIDPDHIVNVYGFGG